MFQYMNNVVFPIGRIGPGGVDLLGTATMLPKAGRFATAAHVTEANDTNLVIVLKDLNSISDYQDTSDLHVKMLPVAIEAIDPVTDLCILKSGADAASNLQPESLDAVTTGDDVHVFGYPHADQGRVVLTYQHAKVGARILIANQGVKTKQIVLNTQSRPGQSGSPVVAGNPPRMVAVLIGSYAPGGGSGISLGGVDPLTLHQTTHAVSAHYLSEMMT